MLGEAISQPLQHRIARNLKVVKINSGEEYKVDPAAGLFIVCSGTVERETLCGNMVSMRLGDFFNEENVLFESPIKFNVRARQDTEVFVIETSLIADVPVARRKMFETFLLRMQPS